MDTSEYDDAFKIISFSGNSKSSSMLAITAAREADFGKAGEHLAEADKDLHAAHVAQTELITEEARGNKVPVNIILVHSQDHLTGAILMRDLAEEFINLYKLVKPTNI